MRQTRRATGLLRLLVVSLTSLALATACDEQDRLPTSPPKAVPGALQAAILGANVAGVPFSVAAINDAGQIVGTQMSGGTSRAMLWNPDGVPRDLGTLGGASSWAYGINESGQVVGASLTTTGEHHAFLWTPGDGMQDLGTLDGARSSTARGVNDHGQVVGESTFPAVGPRQPETHAFLWSLGTGMQDLGTLRQSLTSSIAFDINNAGQVVGRAYSADRQIFPPTDPEYFSRAFLWAPGQEMQDLGDLGGGFSVAYAINDAGQVVGKSWLSRSVEGYGTLLSAFLWTSSQGMRDLGSLWIGPSLTVAYGINEAGQVVGESDLGVGFRAGFPLQGFLWTATDGMEALSPTTGITSARDINDRQQLIGDGRVATLHLTPGNNPPVAVTNGPYSGLKRSAVPLELRGADNDDVGFLYTVSFGDGSQNWMDIYPPGSHTYNDNGTYTLTLTVRDRRGATDTKTTTVTIANVAPTIVAGSLTGPTAPIQMSDGSASAPIAFEFTDRGRNTDSYSAEIACGNGLVLTATNIPVSDVYLGNGVFGGKGAYTGSCTYTSPGVYTVRATVSDDEGGVSAPAFFRYVIVYDPAGGSVTAAGFYDIPGQGNRKAHFTFNAKFLPGHETAPNGAVKFWIPSRELDFESTALETLVVSANRAQFWGAGTLNGAPARFRITAVDGQEGAHGGSADAVRIELWDAVGTLVYDSQPGAAQDAPLTQPIEGGNIRVSRD